jgi:hypothetical protein
MCPALASHLLGRTSRGTFTGFVGVIGESETAYLQRTRNYRACASPMYRQLTIETRNLRLRQAFAQALDLHLSLQDLVSSRFDLLRSLSSHDIAHLKDWAKAERDADAHRLAAKKAAVREACGDDPARDLRTYAGTPDALRTAPLPPGAATVTLDLPDWQPGPGDSISGLFEAVTFKDPHPALPPVALPDAPPAPGAFACRVTFDVARGKPVSGLAVQDTPGGPVRF